MKRQRMLTGVLTLGLLLLLALLVGLSQAQGPEPEAEAEPPVTALQTYSSMRVAGSALRPISSGVGFAPGDEGGGCIYATSDADVVWNTPLYLPQGANVRLMRMYYTDVVTPSNCSGWFTVYNWTGSVAYEWEVTSSGDEGFGYQDTSLISHTINYELYSYVLNWRPVVTGTGMQLCGFRVIYYPPPSGAAFMPIVTKEYHP